jgi:SET domain-containing protein
MNKKQLLNNLVQDTFCRIKPSPIAGVGVFAIRPIPSGTNPFVGSKEVRYITYSKKELPSLPTAVKKLIDDFGLFERDKCLIPEFGFNAIDISHFLNRSSHPNVIAVATGKNGDVEFFTKRKIKTGEELTVDYSSYSDK